jgi:glycosyltransferase involved in cell wall biosynthesis
LKISVVTVCFNAAHTIRFAIESFLAQSYADKELIVVDGASRDETLEIVRGYGSEGIVVVSERDRGIYDAMNKGLGLYRGDAVGFLNADDCFASPDTLASIADGLSQADVVFGNLDFVADHHAKRVVRRWRGEPYRRGAFRRGWLPAHPTFYVRRHVVDTVGAFDLKHRIAADYDYMLRALEVHGFSTAFVDQVLVEMMQGGASNGSLRAYFRSNIEALSSRQQHLGSGAVDFALIAKPLRKLGQFAPALVGR